jgi:hypothetical protein
MSTRAAACLVLLALVPGAVTEAQDRRVSGAATVKLPHAVARLTKELRARMGKPDVRPREASVQERIALTVLVDGAGLRVLEERPLGRVAAPAWGREDLPIEGWVVGRNADGVLWWHPVRKGRGFRSETHPESGAPAGGFVPGSGRTGWVSIPKPFTEQIWWVPSKPKAPKQILRAGLSR